MTPTEMREARIKKKLTQIDVAIACDVSVPAYRLWEAGGTRPTPDNAAKLEKVLGGDDHATDKTNRNK